jgi:hypothetical protein
MSLFSEDSKRLGSTEAIKQVCPCLHHLLSLGQPLGAVVSGPNFVSLRMRQLKFNDVWRKTFLVQQSARHRAETMTRHLLL